MHQVVDSWWITLGVHQTVDSGWDKRWMAKGGEVEKGAGQGDGWGAGGFGTS